MVRTLVLRAAVGMWIGMIVIGGIAQLTAAAQYKVLVVMSYANSIPWNKEVQDGIDSILKDRADVTYFYMDTKAHPETAQQKAAEAYQVYQELQPDGVITSDDNAQTMFVMPYLLNKVKTPVMFCGVNADPAQYGFPAAHVSGVLERLHVKESIAFAQQLVPGMKTVGFLTAKTETGDLLMQQFQREAANYSARMTDYRLVKTMHEALAAAQEMQAATDLLFVTTLQGIADDQGQPMSDQASIVQAVKAYNKPTFTDNVMNVQYGVLCAVVKTGQEQGATAAEMLLKAMQGTPVAEIPITQNQYGRRIINVTTLQQLGIKPRQSFLAGAELVKTAE